jgi:hypothetical protein
LKQPNTWESPLLTSAGTHTSITSLVKLKTNAYNTLVRPQLEYASTVWDPHTANNINNLEKILGWQTLQQRREQQRLTTMYKIHNGLVAVNIHHQYVTPASRVSRTSHAAAYQLPFSANIYHQNSFFPRTVLVWNALPVSVAMAPSVDCFKARLAATYQP